MVAKQGVMKDFQKYVQFFYVFSWLKILLGNNFETFAYLCKKSRRKLKK